MSKNMMYSWISKVKNYDNIYLITGFHEIQIFLLDYDEKSPLNLIVIPENSDIEIFLNKVISNADIGRMRDIPFGVAYWNLNKKSNFFVNKIFFQIEAIFNILRLRFFLVNNLKGKIQTNLFIYAYLGNIQYYIFEKYFSKMSSGHSVIYNVPNLNQISKVKNPKLTKKIIKLIYSLVSGVKMELYKTAMYVTFGSKKFVSNESSNNPWPLIIKKFDIQLPNIDKDAVLIIDAPIQTMLGVKFKESLSRLEQYIYKSIESKDIYLKPHYNHEFGTFDNSDILSKFNIIPKGFPVEIYMHFFNKIYFFTSSAIASSPVNSENVCLLNILEFKEQKFYNENLRIMKDSVSDRISYISFAELT
jgi:hypothetical protein